MQFGYLNHRCFVKAHFYVMFAWNETRHPNWTADSRIACRRSTMRHTWPRMTGEKCHTERVWWRCWTKDCQDPPGNMSVRPYINGLRSICPQFRIGCQYNIIISFDRRSRKANCDVLWENIERIPSLLHIGNNSNNNSNEHRHRPIRSGRPKTTELHPPIYAT